MANPNNAAILAQLQQAIAQHAAKQSIAPVLALYAKQAADAKAATLAHGQAIQGFATAAANASKPQADQVAGIYSTAAANDAGLSKGYSSVAQNAINTDAQAQNDYLAKLGSPQTVAPAGGDHAVGDVLYGLGGAVPAHALNREGAAFGAAAAAVPGSILGRGQQDYTANVWAGRDQQKALADRAALETAKLPQLVQQFLHEYKSEQIQQQSLDASKAALNRSQGLGPDGQPLPGYYTAPNGTTQPVGVYTDPNSGQPVKAGQYYNPATKRVEKIPDPHAGDAAAAKARTARLGALKTARAQWFTLASQYSGSPLKNPRPDVLHAGAYITPAGVANPNAAGAYTNDETKAARTGRKSYNAALNEIYVATAADLISHGVSEAEIRREIGKRLVAAGFKQPSVNVPKPKPSPQQAK